VRVVAEERPRSHTGHSRRPNLTDEVQFVILE
jgi:hypothetical protein